MFGERTEFSRALLEVVEHCFNRSMLGRNARVTKGWPCKDEVHENIELSRKLEIYRPIRAFTK